MKLHRSYMKVLCEPVYKTWTWFKSHILHNTLIHWESFTESSFYSYFIHLFTLINHMNKVNISSGSNGNPSYETPADPSQRAHITPVDFFILSS